MFSCIEKDANGDAQDVNLRVALMQAVEAGRLVAAKRLMNKGANITLEDKYGNTALDLAFKRSLGRGLRVALWLLSNEDVARELDYKPKMKLWGKIMQNKRLMIQLINASAAWQQCKAGKAKWLVLEFDKELSILYNEKKEELNLDSFSKLFIDNPHIKKIILDISKYNPLSSKSVIIDLSFRKLLQLNPVELLEDTVPRKYSLRLKLSHKNENETIHALHECQKFMQLCCAYLKLEPFSLGTDYEASAINFITDSEVVFKGVKDILKALGTPVPLLNRLLSLFQESLLADVKCEKEYREENKLYQESDEKRIFNDWKNLKMGAAKLLSFDFDKDSFKLFADWNGTKEMPMNDFIRYINAYPHVTAIVFNKKQYNLSENIVVCDISFRKLLQFKLIELSEKRVGENTTKLTLQLLAGPRDALEECNEFFTLVCGELYQLPGLHLKSDLENTTMEFCGDSETIKLIHQLLTALASPAVPSLRSQLCTFFYGSNGQVQSLDVDCEERIKPIVFL